MVLDALPLMRTLPIEVSKLCLISLCFLALLVVLWLLNMVFIQTITDPLRHLPGPEGSLFQSHLQQVLDPEFSVDTHKEWRAQFGQTFKFHGFGKYDYRLMSFDVKAVSHIMKSPSYEKPWQTRAFLGRLIGRGIFSVEGDEHKKQRRIVHPAFSIRSIRQMSLAIFQKTDELHDRWKQMLSEGAFQNEKARFSECPASSDGVVVDLAKWISRASFDIMGLIGFDHNFNTLQDDSEGVYNAYCRMSNIVDKGLSFWNIMELYVPVLRRIWVTSDIKTTNESRRIINEIGKDILLRKKSVIEDSEVNFEDDKDLLTLLIKSNLSTDPVMRLTDQELLDQCSTFLLAGSDTVSVAISWCFHLLALHPEVQTRLRKELRAAHDGQNIQSDRSIDSGYQRCKCPPRPLHEPAWAYPCYCFPTTRWDFVANLSYLDAVIRESLRLCSPVHATIRVATQDDTIPVSHSVSLSDGTTVGHVLQSHLKIRKGTYIHIPIEGLNYSEDIWGSDAHEFKPSRWTNTSLNFTKPGINNLMAFGMGYHHCSGNKLAITEMKIFLASLITHFEFLPAEDIRISKFNSVLTRPYVIGQWTAGTQLPIRIREVGYQ